MSVHTFLNRLQFFKNSINRDSCLLTVVTIFTELMPMIYVHVHLFGRLICCALATKRLMYLPAFYDCDF